MDELEPIINVQMDDLAALDKRVDAWFGLPPNWKRDAEKAKSFRSELRKLEKQRFRLQKKKTKLNTNFAKYPKETGLS